MSLFLIVWAIVIAVIVSIIKRSYNIIIYDEKRSKPLMRMASCGATVLVI